jgi:hypothetical protein
MLVPFLGYVVATTVLTAVAVLLTGLVNTSGRHHPPPVIARTVRVEVQRHPPVAKEAPPAKDASPVAKEASPAKDVSSVGKEASPKDVPPIVSTAKADTKKSKHYKPKVLARQRNNRYGNALGYAEEPGYGPRGLWFR